MTLIDQLGIALGLATLAGLNLYLTVAVTGLAVHYNWLNLSAAYEPLQVLGSPWVLWIAGGMFVVEFIADKVPWVDSIWDVAHTIIRPIGGVCLALAALGQLDPLLTTIAVLLAGTATLSSHSTKAGVRALLNLSPEPVTNSVASVTEDGLVLGGLGLIGLFPTVAFFLFVAVVIVLATLAIWLWKKIFRLRRQMGDLAAAATSSAQ